jgi:hypothetical protein
MRERFTKEIFHVRQIEVIPAAATPIDLLLRRNPFIGW